MATKRGKSKKKNPCWKGYTAMGSDGKIVMKKKGNKMVPACRPIKSKDGASMKGDGRKKPTSKKAKSDNTNVKKFVPNPNMAKGDGGVGPIQGTIAPIANKAAAYATDAIMYPFQKIMGEPTMQISKSYAKKGKK